MKRLTILLGAASLGLLGGCGHGTTVYAPQFRAYGELTLRYDDAGRIAPVSTTGLLRAARPPSTACRKYAVSSIVSVPCVTTTPAMSPAERWFPAMSYSA